MFGINFDSGMWSLFYLMLEILAVVSAIHAIWFVRTSQAAVAWVVGLLVFPLAAVPLYWVFGRYRFYGYREALREVGQKHKTSVGAINRELRTGRNVQTTPLQTPLEQLADVLDTPLSSGNRFRLLVDGQAFYDALIQAIESAERYLYLEFYTVRCDACGNRLAEALIAKSQQGVVVRMLYDEVGSMSLSNSYVQRLTEAGVEVWSFNTRQGIFNRFQINFRNHRKLLVVDGSVALVGGLNVGDEYLGKARWLTHWRDTAVEMHGPIARKVQAVFAGDYYWAARRDLPEANWSVPVLRPATKTAPESEESLGTQAVTAIESTANPADKQPHALLHVGRGAVCATGPADDRPRATMMFVAAAGTARRRLWISTPYLVPDETSMVALSMARARGVDVRILVPSVADVWPVFLAGLHYEQEMLAADIPVYRYAHKVMMHQKSVLVDDKMVLIGSTNLDVRSLHLNFELMVAIEDASLVAEMIEVMESDFAVARLSRGDAVPGQRWLTPVGRVIARLFSPVL